MFPAFAHFRRTATCDTELHGQKIKEGEKVVMWYVSSNRDETRYEDPDRFDIQRKAEHQAFGAGGRHFCLGTALARLELRVLIEETLARYPDIELDGEPELRRIAVHQPAQDAAGEARALGRTQARLVAVAVEDRGAREARPLLGDGPHEGLLAAAVSSTPGGRLEGGRPRRTPWRLSPVLAAWLTRSVAFSRWRSTRSRLPALFSAMRTVCVCPALSEAFAAPDHYSPVRLWAARTAVSARSLWPLSVSVTPNRQGHPARRTYWSRTRDAHERAKPDTWTCPTEALPIPEPVAREAVAKPTPWSGSHQRRRTSRNRSPPRPGSGSSSPPADRSAGR